MNHLGRSACWAEANQQMGRQGSCANVDRWHSEPFTEGQRGILSNDTRWEQFTAECRTPAGLPRPQGQMGSSASLQ